MSGTLSAYAFIYLHTLGQSCYGKFPQTNLFVIQICFHIKDIRGNGEELTNDLSHTSIQLLKTKETKSEDLSFVGRIKRKLT